MLSRSGQFVFPCSSLSSRLRGLGPAGSALRGRSVQIVPGQGLRRARPGEQHHPPAAEQGAREQPRLGGHQAHVLRAGGGLPALLGRLHGVAGERVGGDRGPGGYRRGGGEAGLIQAPASTPLHLPYRPEQPSCK